MYTKTKFSGLALAFALLLGVLTIASPQNIHAEAVTSVESTAEVEFNAGELTLPQVATFNFGQQDITTGTATYDAVSVGNAIQVSDLRGNGKGWDLNVSLSQFVHADNDKELTGAYVTLSGTTIEDINETNGNAPASPSTASLRLDSDGEENPIFIASTDAGMGVWSITTELTDAKLTVPSGTVYSGVYEADLNWTLQTTP